MTKKEFPKFKEGGGKDFYGWPKYIPLGRGKRKEAKKLLISVVDQKF